MLFQNEGDGVLEIANGWVTETWRENMKIADALGIEYDEAYGYEKSCDVALAKDERVILLIKKAQEVFDEYIYITQDDEYAEIA
jgi:hypothetical protein